MIEVTTSPQDRRARVLQLTVRGRRERTTLDKRSDELAASLLEPLSPAQRERLVGAMGDVERLLTSASVTIAAVDPEHEDARSCLRALHGRAQRALEPSV